MGNTNSSSLKEFKSPLLSPIKYNKNDSILEKITNFMKSNECRMFIDGFIDENCLLFDTNKMDNITSQNKQILVDLHIKYIGLVNKILTKGLKKLNISNDEFRDACAIHNSSYINPEIMKYILAIDDFNIFLSLMYQRNIALEQQALNYLKKGSNININNELNLTEMEQIQLATQLSLEIPKKMTEEEQIKWAMNESLRMSIDNNNDINNDNLIKIENINDNNPFTTSNNNNNNNNIKIINNNNENSYLNKMQNIDPNVTDFIDEQKSDLDIISSNNMEKKKLKPIKMDINNGNDTDSSDLYDNNDDKLPMLTAEDVNTIKIKMNNINDISNNNNNNDRIKIEKQKKLILNMRKQQRKHNGYQYISLNDDNNNDINDDDDSLGKSLVNAFKKPQ